MIGCFLETDSPFRAYSRLLEIEPDSLQVYLDVETLSQGSMEPYSVGILVTTDQVIVSGPLIFDSLGSCIEDALDYLFTPSHHKASLIGHNILRFDIPVILEELISHPRFENLELRYVGDRCIRGLLKFRCPGEKDPFYLRIQDTLLLMPMSLNKAASSFGGRCEVEGIQHNSMVKGSFPHDFMTTMECTRYFGLALHPKYYPEQSRSEEVFEDFLVDVAEQMTVI